MTFLNTSRLHGTDPVSVSALAIYRQVTLHLGSAGQIVTSPSNAQDLANTCPAGCN